MHELFHDKRARLRFASAVFSLEETEQAVHQRFEKQVHLHGNCIAVKARDYQWTYKDLNCRANRIAHAITERCSVGADHVALLFGDDGPALSAIIGALKAAKVYVPIISSNPPARIRSVLEDSASELIVTNNRASAQAQALAGSKGSILNIDEINRDVSDKNPGLYPAPDSLACILYTSGSTGKPKGVMQTHRNILHQVYRYSNMIGITAADRLSLLPSFDVGAGHLDIYGAFLNGASLYPFNIREEGIPWLIKWFAGERITVYHSVPTLFRQIALHLAGSASLSAVRIVNLGGEQVTFRDVNLFKEYFGRNCVLVNSLACTEAGPFVQYFIDHDTELKEGTVPIGYPAEGIDIQLRDDLGKNIDGPGTGEMLVKSRYLSPGYWRNPELTHRLFISGLDEQEAPLFITGDVGRMKEDGTLYYLGRKDFQVKIRGYRVEIPEIEIALQRHTMVREAAVLGHEDGTGKKYLTAYVVLQQGAEIKENILRAYLCTMLPDYMIPSLFVFLESLPMTSHGKLDRNALRTIQPDEMNREDICMVPVNPFEKRMIELWHTLLQRQNIGVNDNFFDLGGDSLAVIDLFCRIEKEYGKRIAFSTIFERPTVRLLTALVAGTSQPEPASLLIPVRTNGTKPPLFVIPAILSNVLSYTAILKYLDQERIVYGIEMSESDLERPLEETVANCIEMIRKACPYGPYSLLGYSSGGIMAFEIAQQLSAMNAPVLFLGMVDTMFPASSERQLRVGREWYLSFAKNIPYWLVYSLPFWMRYHIQLTKNSAIRTYERDIRNKLRKVKHWLEHYSPGPYPGRVLFYRASAQGLFKAKSDKGWEKVCADLDIHTIPGNHTTMIHHPYAGYLAEDIDLELCRLASGQPYVCR